MDDESLCHRFSKRLKLSNNLVGPYAEANCLLGVLHTERLSRRNASYMNTSSMSVGAAGDANSSTPTLPASSTWGVNISMADSAPMTTSFTLADVVYCAHGQGGRCLQCSGRWVQNVPLPLYSAFCSAYDSASESASSSSSYALVSGSGRERVCAELSFPAFLSLAASLAPESGERFLHLGGGTGRTAIAWALLFPQSPASSVESCPSLHAAATAARTRLADLDAQCRVFLHNCDALSVQSDWRQASIVFVSLASYDDQAMAHIVRGLTGVEAGTRVVAISYPLAGYAGAGFVLVRQAAYRTTSGMSNCTAFIYKKLAESS
eukprot:gnl/TRDRNA2_/TRDRNA2_40047_c0_seq1.p1 gnl/TRDRNA2_/TRDRNA2_40047_c0~~gnl/TRDRNA2_/TRDRNA2_40047_c0_seq1.p1  ORF type:complete len:354 (+),score=26.07 gnl/TRDRNA2_/TRDRNA2_40047_c0_seq1:102-1064(+)